MATFQYANTTVLKKMTIGQVTYYLADEDLRKIVEGFGTATSKDFTDAALNADGAKLPTEKVVADYVAGRIEQLTKAMRYMGVVTRQSPEQSDVDAIANHYAELQETPNGGDVVIMSDNTLEYIYNEIKQEWESFGDNVIYLTKLEAEKTYTPLTRTIAGLPLSDNITTENLSDTDHLNLKALSHKDSVQGQVEVVNSAEDITVAKTGAYNVTGTTVDVPTAYNAIDVTPAGSVELTAETQASATYDKVNNITISASAPSEQETSNYTPEGTVTLPDITTKVALTPVEIDKVENAGTGYSLTKGAVDKGNDTVANFVKKGVRFSVDSVDECLKLSYVETQDPDFAEFYTNAVTESGAVSYTAPELTGSIPTFSKTTVASNTAPTVTSEYAGGNNKLINITGKGTKLAAAATFETANAAVTQPTFKAGFTGTDKTITPTVSATKAAQAPDGIITILTTTTPITLNKTTTTVTSK